jgi:Reverse transcriptase (RNA-dependent DNA polymerase)
VSRHNVPKERNIIGNRWSFTRRDNGQFFVCTVVNGYNQIPSEDFQENHASVIYDISFNTIMAMSSIYQLASCQFDIETAFLYEDLEEAIYMEFPTVYDRYLIDKQTRMGNKKIKMDIKTSCLLLKKTLYVLVNLVVQWWKKSMEVFYEIGFKQTKVDPYMFVKNGEGKRSNAMTPCVDNGGIYVTAEDTRKVLHALLTIFKQKKMGKSEEFVVSHQIESKEKITVWMNQPRLIKHFEIALKILNTAEGVYKTSVGLREMIL